MKRATFMHLFLSLAIYGSSEAFNMKNMNLSPGDTIKGFRFIGGGRAKGLNQLESLYYASPTDAAYENAQASCVKAFGNYSNLIRLESWEETEEVLEMLHSGPNGRVDTTTYWLAGKLPKISETVKMGISSEANSVFQEFSRSTKESGFICELIEPIPEYVNFDLILIVESSVEVLPEEHYKPALDFAREVSIAWSGWEHTRMSFMIYSEQVQTRFRLDNELSQREIADNILAAAHMNLTVKTNVALDTAYYLLPDCRCYETPRNIILLTSGKSVDTALTKQAAERFGRAEPSVNLLTVGIGAAINWQELQDVASNTSYVFGTATNDFVRLKDILREFVTDY